jgi:hypothetical protein
MTTQTNYCNACEPPTYDDANELLQRLRNPL